MATGSDVIRYLQSQLAQDVASLADGEHCWSLLLEPDGKVVALVRVIREGEAIRIECDPGAGEAVVARLRRFLLRVDVALDLVAVAAGVDERIEVERVARGFPRHGYEIIPGATVPAELGVLGFAVSFTKGCYPGQELVERMDSRSASAPNHLVVLESARAVGSEVVIDGQAVGTITSSAGGCSIARVKRGVSIGRPAPIDG
jgi:folate-binding protein YgfZ